ncbi:uncharacterized protein TM35_000381860 [Trypanosoma theileri]|uniref:Uncharacterized protein n=1 Tax=Trypanosoma theileri TaxID=67003 RepID=A0A1X0NKI8_9TRYP|nr:uncharacterized protein TM35_000381860 [Trypanosoma theileri]ORC85111.1 hypothetical protein TM35_000381860 [Trypanosoma theileri]
MEGQKNDWTSAHAQLWTSFKKAQQEQESYDAKGDVGTGGVEHTDSLLNYHYPTESELASIILNEVRKPIRSDEPVFSEELEARVIEVIESSRTEPFVRDLMTSIIHLKNSAEKARAEAFYRGESLTDVINKTLFYLNGTKPSNSKDGDSSVVETVTENTKVLGDIETNLLAILIQVEKCMEMTKTLVEKNSLDKKLSNESSLRDMLNLLYSSNQAKRISENVEMTDKDQALCQVMDILGATPGSDPSQAPKLALKLMNELEKTKREKETNSVLLLQYERAVMTKFASCGVVFPPTVEQERAALCSNENHISHSQNDRWIKEDLKTLISVMNEVKKRCFLNVVPNFLREEPLESSAEAVLEHMRATLTGARDLLITMANEEMEAKHILTETLGKLKGNKCDDKILQVPFNEEKSFIEIVNELKYQVDHKSGERLLESSIEEKNRRHLDTIMRIARWLPEDDKVQILELQKEENALLDYVEGAVRRLVALLATQDPVSLQIKMLQSQLTKLAESSTNGDTQPLDKNVLSGLMDTAEQLRLWAMKECENCVTREDAIIRQSLYELAQLIPTGVVSNSSGGNAQIDPPVNNLIEMIRLLKKRQEQWIQEQQKQQLSGAQSRLEKVRIEELVKERSKQLIRITKEILLSQGNSTEMEELLGVLSAEMLEEPSAETGAGILNNGNGITVSSLTAIFDDLEERLKVIKTRYHRLFQSFGANKVRLENLIQSSNIHNKRWMRICNTVKMICRTVGLEQTALHLEANTKTEVVSSTSKFVLRPEQRKTHVTQPVNDGDILEALKLVEERLKDDKALTERAVQKSEILRLQEEEQQWHEETETFRQALQMILQRLAEAGRRVKRTLYMLGTDENAEDEVVESVIGCQWQSKDDNEKKEEKEDDCIRQKPHDQVQEQKEEKPKLSQEASEESLAVLLQKFGRWAVRLQEATEDHLYTQQKLIKYFAAVHRFFCTADNAEQTITDENLLDIDAALMRFADGILPVLDRAIGVAQSSTSKDNKNTSCGSRTAALSLLLKDAPTDRVLPTDHRLLRLYESVGKLRTMVAALLSVRYLSIPSSTRRRGGDAPDELIFEDVWGETYVDLDVGSLKDISNNESGGDKALHISDDVLFRALEKNISSVYHALGKFSTNYKLAAILLQKDTEMIQQFIATMLEPYIGLDVDRAFNQDPAALSEIYVLLKERSTRQRGCYFFNRVGGEGPCVWAVGLEQLSVGFVGILEKLRKRTQTAVDLRELIDDVVDLCAMYVNWVEVNGTAITSSHPFPQVVIDSCLREDEEENEEEEEDEDGAVVDNQKEQKQGRKQRSDSSQKPPLLPGHHRAKISHFDKDEIVLKIIAHMFQVTQDVANFNKKAGELQQQQQQQQQQMEEELQLLRETAVVAEQRTKAALEECQRIEEGRDKALSEAAVSRAELRRWKRLHDIAEDQTPPSWQKQEENQNICTTTHEIVVPATLAKPLPLLSSSLPETAGSLLNGLDAKDTLLLQVAQSMVELTAELRGAYQRSVVPPTPAPAAGTETTTATATGIENTFEVPCAAQSDQRGSKTKTHLRHESSLRSSGLVRSPKECGDVGSARGSVSPRSTGSSPLPPSTQESHSQTDVELGQQSQARGRQQQQQHHHHHHHQEQEQQQQQEQLEKKRERHSVPRAAVVVTPACTTYSSLGRVTGSAPRVPSALRYQPCDHRGEFFNECDVCSRRHRSSRPTTNESTRAMQMERLTQSSSRSRSPRHGVSAHSSRSRSSVTGASPPYVRYVGRTSTSRDGSQSNYHHRVQQTQRQQHGPLTGASSKMISPSYTEREDARSSTAVHEHRYLATTPHHHHNNKRTDPSSRASVPQTPSTSTVLSPESVDSASEAWNEQERRQQHQQQKKIYGRSLSRSSKGRQESEGVDLGASFDLVSQHTGPTRSPTPPSMYRNMQPLHQKQKHLQSSATPTRRSKIVHNPNLGSGALRKLADIVAKTKIAGREEL